MNLSEAVLKVLHSCGLSEKVVLASYVAVVHHRRNYTVRGGEHDKTHSREGISQEQIL